MTPLLLALLLATHPEGAAARSHEVIGLIVNRGHRIVEGESLVELAQQYDVGFNEIAAANPGLDPFIPQAGATAIIPSAWIVPPSAPGVVVVNLSEMRLYYILGSGPPLTFPVGVAQTPDDMPLGGLEVVAKAINPTWYPTPALRGEDPTLPEAVPPGPDNPLGSRALRTSRRNILIHGTNKPFGVGREVSRGCIRLYDEDMLTLFQLVEVGTRIKFVREPVKIGLRQERIFVEIHEDEALRLDAQAEAERLLRRRGVLDRVDRGRLADAVRAKSGMPVDVTAGPR